MDISHLVGLELVHSGGHLLLIPTCRFFSELSISQMKCPRCVHMDISAVETYYV